MEKKEHYKYINDWKRKNAKRIAFDISKEKDPDIIEMLEKQTSMSAYIKDLIRQDIERRSEKQ